LLVEDTVKETCTRCHGEKEGPFTFEHSDVNDECTACHSPHGSVNNNMLKVSQPFLCLQCHIAIREQVVREQRNQKGSTTPAALIAFPDTWYGYTFSKRNGGL